MTVAAGVAAAYALRLSQANRATLMAHSAAERVNLLLGSLIGELAPPIDDDGAKLVPVLDRTAGWLDQELAGEPWALARAHVSMGLLYARAQRWPQADRHLTRAIDDYRALGDPDRSAVAEAMRLLGLARAYQGSADAVELQREARAIAGKINAPGALDLSNYHSALAETLVVLGAMKYKAEADLEIARALLLLRNNDRRYFAWEAEHLSAYGRAWLHSGYPAEAVPYLKEASDLFEQAQMPLESCPYHRACQAMLAQAHELSGNVEAAAQARKDLEAARVHATSIPPYTKGD
jgi:tetratricopeptide (TPR) repeat protein